MAEHDDRKNMADKVGASEERRLKARREGDKSVWFGLGMMGLVGWSVAVPTLIGVAVGLWLDTFLETERSWTLTLLLAGVALGCLNAWFWVKREMERD